MEREEGRLEDWCRAILRCVVAGAQLRYVLGAVL